MGIIMGGTAVACYLWPWHVDAAERPAFARAAAFSLLALSPLFHALNCRSPTASLVKMKPLLPATLFVAIVVSAAIHLVAVVVPDLRNVFHTYALDSSEWLIVLALSASIIPAIELLKLLQRTGIVGRDLGPMSRRA